MSGPTVPVTLIVPVRDEAATIADFLAAHAWADERLVIDNGSTDGTAAIARAAGATVLDAPATTIGGARNVGFAAARHPWVLALDADERADPALADELRRVLAAPTADAYRIRRRNLYLGREQTRGAWGRDWVVRLARRELRYDASKVHELLVAPGPVGTLAATVHHEPYRDLAHHLAKMDRYARWGAEELYAAGRRATPFDLVGRPLWRFLKAYLVNGSVLDGRFGLATSLLGAQTAFLKYAHLWALERDRARGR